MARDRRAEKRVTVYRASVPDGEEIWEVEYEAVSDALHFACRDLREGRRQPIEILEEGEVLYDAAGIAAACRELDAERVSISETLLQDGNGGRAEV